jgi:hypothetical protein
MRRTIFSFFAGIALLSGALSPFVSSVLHPPVARAVVPVFDTAVLSTTKGQLLLSTFEWSQSFILEALKKRMLDMIVDQIIQWIQGGGKPQFVTDWSGFLKGAANVAIGDFAQQINGGILCSPFSAQLQVTLFPVQRFTDQITCTLDEVLANIDNFYSDFRQGNWIAYTTMLQPQNNYFGALAISASERDKRINAAQHAAETEAIAGSGFLSTKSCSEDPQSGNPDTDHDGTPGDVNCTITTPGDTIGATLSKAIGSDIDYIVNADQLQEYIAAISNAILNRVIIAGAQGLQGTNTPNAPSGGSTGGGVGACNGLTGAQLQACLDYVTQSNGSFSVSKTTLIDQIGQVLAPRNGAQKAYQSSLTSLTQYIADLQNLLATFNNLPKNPFSGIPCTNFATYVANINAEIAWANSEILAISNDIALNKAIMDQLNVAVTKIQALAKGDWANFSAIVSQLDATGALDLTIALNLQTTAEDENQKIKSDIAQNIIQFNLDLQSCQQGI